jgi:hypothetical protein
VHDAPAVDPPIWHLTMRRILLLAIALPCTATAQQDSVLREAVRLATEGQSDSARTLVRDQLDAIPPLDPRYPEILFTAGVVSSDADSATAYFRRVSIEYSTSEWADRALLRLAQLRYAAGDLNGALRPAERILLDYPFSEVRGHAAFWAARASFDMRDPGAGCRYMGLAKREAGDDVELANRAGFYLQRCEPPGGGVDSTVADSVEAPARTQPDGPRYSVQVAAVSSAVAADQAMRRLRSQGYDAHVIRDQDGLLKVRVGQFDDRSEAEALAQELKRRLGGNPFVVERQ